jgi:predicted flap endonuclease-1-like 5' DNA nuclease
MRLAVFARLAYNARGASRPDTFAGRLVYALSVVVLIALAVGIAVVAYRAGARSAAALARRPIAHPGIERREASIAAIAHEEEPPPPSVMHELPQLTAFAEERRQLLADLADARGEIARYRQIVVDIERNAPPPLLDAPGTPDDLKLIVGIGPVIERMLYQMGIGTYRQIARWSERDIDDVDARLPEFPGRIRRDGWVTQARALHIGKYGTNP